MEQTEMSDEKQVTLLRALMSRSVGLELQLMALKRLLEKKEIITEQEFDRLAAVFRDTYKEHLETLARAQDEQALSDFLRKFEGPVQ